MFAFATAAISVCMILLMIRLFAGPTLYDRVAALNQFGTCTVLFIGACGLAFGRPDFLDIALLYALTQLAPYCGTGHKTTFGLGETQLGWHTSQPAPQAPTQQRLLAERMDELTEIFLSTKKRQGGRHAIDTAETSASILARREMGDSLQEIADDMELAYETAKTYSKLARRAMRELTRREYDG